MGSCSIIKYGRKINFRKRKRKFDVLIAVELDEHKEQFDDQKGHEEFLELNIVIGWT